MVAAVNKLSTIIKYDSARLLFVVNTEKVLQTIGWTVKANDIPNWIGQRSAKEPSGRSCHHDRLLLGDSEYRSDHASAINMNF